MSLPVQGYGIGSTIDRVMGESNPIDTQPYLSDALKAVASINTNLSKVL